MTFKFNLHFKSSQILPAVLAFTVGLFGLTSVLTAQPATPPAGSAEVSPEALKRQQEQNAKLFKDLEQAMLRLAQRLEKSDRPEDQARAKTIRKALDLSTQGNVNKLFQDMVANFAKTGNPNSGDLGKWIGDDEQLRQALTEILAILMTDDDTARLKAEIERLKAFLKEAERIKRAQEIIQARTDAAREKGDRISKDQRDLAEQTRDLAERMAGNKKPGDSKKPGDPNAAKPKDDRAEAKPEGKPGDPNAEQKNDTGESKSNGKDDQGKDPSGKEGSKDGAESKPMGGEKKPGQDSGKEGDPKDSGSGKDSGEPKPSESKDGDPKGGEPKNGGEPKAGEPKNGGEPKGGEPKPGDPKNGGEPKPGDPKGGEPKPGDPKNGGEPKPGDPKGGEPKAGEPQAGEPKESQGAGKPSESKSQGQGKGQSKPSGGEAGEGKSDPKDSQGSPSQGSQSKGSPPQASPPQGSQGNQPQQPPQPQDDTRGRKQIKEAYPDQKGAEDNLKKDEKTEASKKEEEAIKKIADAIRELEKRLKQLREEEMLKLLANLEARCNNMLRMQIEVYENTKSIHAAVEKNAGQKSAAEIQKSQVQSDKEAEIVVEADKALKMLEGEGSAVAFAGVLAEVRNDMVSVKVRLAAAYVGTDTQQIEKDIIDQLKEMIAALKKAQQQAQSGQGQPGQPGKPGNQPLIDKLAELKLMRALQAQVNSRTTMHSKTYKGEQAKDPIMEAELRQLSARQAKIQDMLHKLATGANQ